MKQFTVSQLLRFSGDVLLAAVSAPVEILQRGKPRYIIMTTEHYEVLTRRKDQGVQTGNDDPA
mgnify:CR=1 FL=1